MNKTHRCVIGFLVVWALIAAGTAVAQNPGPDKDPFKGRLFPPNVILEHQQALELSEQQLKDIRSAVIEVQSNIAEHQWDLRDAYQRVMTQLEQSPVDEASVLNDIDQALAAENKVKRMQVAMLIRLRNVLTEEQFAYLQATRNE